jgi:hypothetical protein
MLLADLATVATLRMHYYILFRSTPSLQEAFGATGQHADKSEYATHRFLHKYITLAPHIERVCLQLRACGACSAFDVSKNNLELTCTTLPFSVVCADR